MKSIFPYVKGNTHTQSYSHTITHTHTLIHTKETVVGYIINFETKGIKDFSEKILHVQA